MRGTRLVAAFALAFLAACAACSSRETSGLSMAPAEPAASTPAPAADGLVDQSQAPQQSERKIIRNGELDLETDDPLAGQRQLVAIAESNDGFVVTSESRQLDEKRVTVSATLRIPAARFDTAIEAIRALGGRVLREKVTGQDVTEEYVDLQARIRTKQAVEAQYLEIMKQARTVPDVLAVQEKLGAIRAEIEQLEGRLRFLENQTSLSTIKVSLTPPSPVVSSTGIGFFDEVRRALGNTVDVFLGVLVGLVWFASYFIPLAIVIGIPGYFVLRFLWRRLTKRARSEP
jgi:hypothetical protein